MCESVEGWGWRRTHRITETTVEGWGLGYSLAPAALGGLDIPYTGSKVNDTIAVYVKWDSSGLTWEGLQVLQDGGHGHLLLQGAVTEVLMVQEAEESGELWDELLQHWGGKVRP